MTRIPNVPERVKEAPAHALRAVFAGIGQALLLSDRVRRRIKGPQGTGADTHDAATVTARRPTAVKPAATARAEPATEAATVTSITKPTAKARTAASATGPAARTPTKG
ncbi:MAG TPA: hypothetical protein VKD26_07825, partial [Streptosporangiaceae bacterium]|nr:hypothetical protein [Streptosporangiaceae bacterium]